MLGPQPVTYGCSLAQLSAPLAVAATLCKALFQMGAFIRRHWLPQPLSTVYQFSVFPRLCEDQISAMEAEKSIAKMMEEKVNTEDLIHEVEKRPVIWNSSM